MPLVNLTADELRELANLARDKAEALTREAHRAPDDDPRHHSPFAFREAGRLNGLARTLEAARGSERLNDALTLRAVLNPEPW